MTICKVIEKLLKFKAVKLSDSVLKFFMSCKFSNPANTTLTLSIQDAWLGIESNARSVRLKQNSLPR